MKQGLPITILAVFGVITSFPAAATGESAPNTIGALVLVAERHAPPARRAKPSRRPKMKNSTAAIPAGSYTRGRPAGNNVAVQDESEFSVDSLISTSLINAETSGPKKRNLEFSGRTGPKLRIGLRQKKVRFALNFQLVEDIFFAPAYRLAIAKADFQNPDGYWAHSVFFGMRFKFKSGTQ